jgi:hypothetical protein
MKLDATPLGKPLYAKLGFVDEYEIERWILKRPPAVSTTARSTCPRLVPVQLEQIFQFDSELFGADRSSSCALYMIKAQNLQWLSTKTDCHRVMPSGVVACLRIISDRGWPGAVWRRESSCRYFWPNHSARLSS